MGSLDNIQIIIFAIAAGYLVFQLWSVLGRRTGHEQQHREKAAERQKLDPRDSKDAPVPAKSQNAANDEGGFAEIVTADDGNSSLAQGLTEIQLADRSFDGDEFLAGAKRAYEMIVTAFADGDKRQLKSLLSDDVFQGFEQVLRSREEAEHKVESSFVGIESAKIEHAELVDRVAEVTIRFVSELISATKDSEGAIIEGDPNQVREVRDVWTFARDTRSSDPNWRLISTSAGQ